MNIVLFIHSLGDGGAERVCSYIANYLSGPGHDVVLVTIDGFSENDYQLDPRVRRVSLDMAKQSDNVVDAVVSNSKLVVKLKAVLRDCQADAVLSFMTRANVICAISCAIIDTYHVAAERNFPGMDNQGKLWNKLRKLSYGFADVVVAQTDKGRSWLETETSAKRVVTIPNPIIYPLPVSGNVSSEKHEIAIGKFVLAVGRLTPQKQFDQLIKAFAALSDEHAHWRLIILGDGAERSNLQKLASDLGVGTRVSLPGRVQDVGEWYERADIFVLSSRYEGFPNALAEAMSYGLPVVSYDCDTGPSELIEHGVNGYLVEPNNEQKMSQSILQLMLDDSLRVRFGKEAEKVRSTFAFDEVMKMWARLLPNG